MREKGKKGVTSSGNRLRVVPGGRGAKRGGRDGARSLRASGGLASLETGRGHGRLITLSVILGILLLLAGAAAWALQYFHVKNIYVEGNLHYTDEEIIGFVTSERFGDNSLYLSLKYKDKGIENIPFIQKMNVQVLAPDTIKIIVYEKAVAGYVQYLDGFMYFDKDGIIVEAAETRTEGIPEITGIHFDQVVLYEPLPVDNQDVFQDILYMTQVLGKYGIAADKIYFDDTYEMTLYFGDVRARLGDGSNMEEKIARLSQILPAAQGKKGVFRLENYTGSGDNVSFEQDK